MRSDAHEGLARGIWGRVPGAVLALLVQALFFSALWFAAVRYPERPSQRETILFLHPPVPATTIDARGRAARRPGTTAPVPSTVLARPGAAPSLDLRDFGRALSGCAPEKYAELSPEDRKHCPKPGEGLAVNPPPDLLGDRSYVKNNARWANALAHEQSPTLLPGGILFPLAALGAILDGSITERSSAFRDPEKWQMYGSGSSRERNREAARIDPSQMDRQAPGRH
jgi:hypothetical protein